MKDVFSFGTPFLAKNCAPETAVFTSSWLICLHYLVSPFLNGFIILFFEVDIAVEFPAQQCIVKRHFHSCHCSFPPKKIRLSLPFQFSLVADMSELALNKRGWRHLCFSWVFCLGWLVGFFDCALCQSCLQGFFVSFSFWVLEAWLTTSST